MQDRPLSIAITTGTLLTAVVVFAAAWALWYLRDVVLVVLVAIVIATAIEPGVRALMARRFPRTIAVLSIYVGLFLAFFGVFYSFLPSVLSDFTMLVSSIPRYLDAITSSEAFTSYAQILGMPQTGISAADIMGSVRSTLDPAGNFANPLSAISQIFGGLFSLILIIVFSFYFAMVETGVDDFLRVVTPRAHQPYVLGLWRRAQEKIGLWMQGQLLLAVIIGVIIFLGLTIFGVKHALLLAVIAALFEIIPVFGPTLAAIPAVAIALADGGAGLVAATIALYAIAQQFENHLIYPLVVTRVVGVPPLLVILALICGAELAGFLGIILSVPIAATIQELARDIASGRFGREDTHHHA